MVRFWGDILLDCGLLAVSLPGGRTCGALWGLFCKSINPIDEALPLWPKHLPNAPLPNTITLGIRISVYKLGRRIWTFRPEWMGPWKKGRSLGLVRCHYLLGFCTRLHRKHKPASEKMKRLDWQEKCPQHPPVLVRGKTDICQRSDRICRESRKLPM